MIHLDLVEQVAEADLQQIEAGLNGANERAWDKRPLNCLCWDENGRLLGGLVGNTHWGWLYVKLLWVDASQRGSGLGRQLLAAAEAEARQRGCRAAHVNTYSFQAPDFYQKCGYTVFGQLPDYPAGEQRIYLWKQL